MSNKKKKKKYSSKRHSLEAKRQKIAADKRSDSNSKMFFIGAGVLVVAALVVGIYYSQSRNTNAAGTNVATNQNFSESEKVEMTDIESKVENGKIIVTLSEIKSKKLIGFQYTGTSQPVPLLAYVSPAGKLVTAVSICEPCDGKRFHFEGDNIVCNTCGTRWDINTLKGISGGCMDYPPDVLENTVNGDSVQIDENLVNNWKPRV